MERAIGERHVHQGKGQLQNGSKGTPVQAGLQLLVEIIASQGTPVQAGLQLLVEIIANQDDRLTNIFDNFKMHFYIPYVSHKASFRLWEVKGARQIDKLTFTVRIDISLDFIIPNTFACYIFTLL